MHKGRLARHARVNMNLVPCDYLEQTTECADMSAFKSVFEAVAEMDEQEDAAQVFVARGMMNESSDVDEETAAASSYDEERGSLSGDVDIDDVCL
jgi:hypothetical protein